MVSNILQRFGHTIRIIRISKGISQETFADMCELHRTYISDIELGKRNISLENIVRIASALGLPISELFRKVEEDASI